MWRLIAFFNRRIDGRSAKLRWLTHQTGLCESLAQALVQTRRPLRTRCRVRVWPLTNEYERARARMLRVAGREQVWVRVLRVLTLNPQLIQASQQLRQVRRFCKRCAAVNSQRVRNGESFQCLLAGQVNDVKPFRYQLNEKGQVVG